VPPAQLGTALALLDALPTCCAQPLTWLADGGTGQIWVHMALSNAGIEALAAELHAWLRTWRAQLQRCQGYAVVESAPASLRAQLDLWGHPSGWQLLQRYKQQFDPQGILNPGRYIAGL
jgi:FAD/FMN-containing dehydrogenase